MSTLENMKFLLKSWFNVWYRFFPPESVKYWKSKEAARAKVIHGADGSLQMQIEGEKYPFPGFPRGHVLTGSLAGVKHKLKNMVFNKAFEELEKMEGNITTDAVPAEKMAPAVRELHRVLMELENAEIVPDMKGRIKLIRKVLCHFFNEDDAYRFRFQWAMERMNMSKIKLSKADKYYFRGKYFKVDHDIFDY